MEIRLLGNKLDFDVMDEINEFEWSNSGIRGDNFCACSPFRKDSHPSFGINVETGLWNDYGSNDDYYRKGNIVKILSFLRQETIEETVEYLIDKYAVHRRDIETLKLNINLEVEQKSKRVYHIEDLRHLYNFRTNYLDSRGISREIQRRFIIGYNPQTKAVAFLWRDLKGNVINVKYRRTDSKTFFYESGGQAIGNFVYGLYECVKEGAKRVYICESEIDALTLWTKGFYAIALGGSHLSEQQISLILKANIEELVIATDNDSVGQGLGQVIKEELGGSIKILDITFPKGVKDVNEMSADQLHLATENLKLPKYNFIKVLTDK